MNCLFVQFPLIENKIEIHKTKKKREREREREELWTGRSDVINY